MKVSFSGTSDGFGKFCTGETVINNASRPISREEMQACGNAKIRYFELPVAFDAITIVVNPQNTWAEDITVEELKIAWSEVGQRQVTVCKIFVAAGPVSPLFFMAPVRPRAPMTTDYFSEVILGEGVTSRSDYVASEDDEILAQGIKTNPNALGYFGFAYFEAHQGELKALAVDAGAGPVAPARETVENGQYQPLSLVRSLFT